jgi:hypothetical protein
MLATVYLSEHRFRDAIREAARARDERPRDDWNYGVMGDGHLELGEYDEAFASFKQMMDLRPTAAAYARVSYALELQGKLDAAIEAMRLRPMPRPRPTSNRSPGTTRSSATCIVKPAGSIERRSVRVGGARVSRSSLCGSRKRPPRRSERRSGDRARRGVERSAPGADP